MGRYRPPRQKGSPYITPEGAKALEDELHQLWKVERPTVTAAVHAAALNGDRSENGDYIYGKRRLREIDSRVRFLRLRLDAGNYKSSTRHPVKATKSTLELGWCLRMTMARSDVFAW